MRGRARTHPAAPGRPLSDQRAPATTGHRPSLRDVRAQPSRDISASSTKPPGMDDETRRRLLRAVIGEDQPGRGRVRRWTTLEAAERAGLVLNHARRALDELRARNPPLVWSEIDARSGEELWWLLPSGLNELDRLEAGERR